MDIGLYIHIPFCIRKCAYCDFCSRPSGDDVKRAYVRALIKEIQYMSSKFEGKIDTVYVGGGTPSCLPRGEFARLAGAVFSCFDCEVSEFTAEANPESFDESKADEYERSGVTRVSLGVQSTDNGILRLLGRAHDFETAKAIILECVKGLDYALEDPEPFVGVEAHAASSVDIAVKFWVPTDKYYDAKYAMREAVKIAFDANGIEIPYPQLQIHTAADKESKTETKKK